MSSCRSTTPFPLAQPLQNRERVDAWRRDVGDKLRDEKRSYEERNYYASEQAPAFNTILSPVWVSSPKVYWHPNKPLPATKELNPDLVPFLSPQTRALLQLPVAHTTWPARQPVATVYQTTAPHNTNAHNRSFSFDSTSGVSTQSSALETVSTKATHAMTLVERAEMQLRMLEQRLKKKAADGRATKKVVNVADSAVNMSDEEEWQENDGSSPDRPIAVRKIAAFASISNYPGGIEAWVAATSGGRRSRDGLR